MRDKALKLLGLMRVAGAIEIGADRAAEATAAGKTRLLLLASDAGENVLRKAEHALAGKRDAGKAVDIGHSIRIIAKIAHKIFFIVVVFELMVAVDRDHLCFRTDMLLERFRISCIVALHADAREIAKAEETVNAGIGLSIVEQLI